MLIRMLFRLAAKTYPFLAVSERQIKPADSLDTVDFYRSHETDIGCHNLNCSGLVL